CATLGEILELWGHDVEAAPDGSAALRMAGERPPDVVLLDIGLPGMDGYEVARRLRAQHPAARMRIVALTGYGQEESRQRSRAAGFDLHLTKPADANQIRQLLAEPTPAEE